MVVTRSKAIIDYKEPSDDEMEDLTAKTMTKRKRARTARKSQAGGAKNHPTSSSGDPLTRLPLDVVYEILGLLTPLDLLHLARTSKALRSYLMSKRSLIAWKAARAAATPPVPVCPKDISEPQLAVLLFTKECTICGKSPSSYSLRIWWTLRLRACKPCFESHVISGRVARQHYLYLEDFSSVLEALPGEPRRESYWRTWAPPNHYYLLEDVRQMSEAVEHYQLRLEARVVGSRQELEQFLEVAKSSALERAESAKVLLEWWSTWWGALWERKAELRRARKQEIISRLTELGHNLQDAQQAVYSYPWLFSRATPLTVAAWKRLRPKAERLVEEQNSLRIEREEDLIRKTRRAAFRQRYSTFKSSYTKTLKTLMPSEKVLIRTHGSIKGAIETDGTDISSRIFDDAFSELPTYLDQWRNERKSELTRLILEARNETGMELDLDTTEEQDVLYLATSVFATCGNWHSGHDDGTVHWADSIGEHFPAKAFHTQKRKSATPHEEMQCIRVVSDWVEHIKLIVRAVGLDPNTATAEDMDNLDARFYCDDCSVVKYRVERVARTWRNCIMHIGFHSKSSPCKGWTLLSSADRAIIDEHEKKLERYSTRPWGHLALSLSGTQINLRGYRLLRVRRDLS
ncbi:hypothetical protein FS837_001841 [Tulasnella sp. UAMH 9824]|nr:hypothetical protein FS837_001841 [Tulasnella sp. UAMH 9824]